MDKTTDQKNDGIRHVTVGSSASIGALPSIQEVQYLLPDSANPPIFRHTERSVIDNRPFPCNICGNRFRQQCHLTQHIRIHTNDRPYHCSHCEKAFKQKSQV